MMKSSYDSGSVYGDIPACSIGGGGRIRFSEQAGEVALRPDCPLQSVVRDPPGIELDVDVQVDEIL